MKGNGIAAWQLHLMGFTLEHALHVLPLEPARGEDLVAVHFDLAGKTLRKTANHQTRRKGPGLACEIAHLADAYPNLFINLAPDGFFDRFPRLDEARQRGIMPTREAFV